MSLDHYDSAPPLNQQASMAFALQTGERYDVILPSTSKGKSTRGIVTKTSGLGLLPMPSPRPMKRPISSDNSTPIVNVARPTQGSLKFKFRKMPKITRDDSSEDILTQYDMIQEPQEDVNDDQATPTPQETVNDDQTPPGGSETYEIAVKSHAMNANKENHPLLANVQDPTIAGMMLLINQDQKLNSERNALYRDLLNKLK